MKATFLMGAKNEFLGHGNIEVFIVRSVPVLLNRGRMSLLDGPLPQALNALTAACSLLLHACAPRLTCLVPQELPHHESCLEGAHHMSKVPS